LQAGGAAAAPIAEAVVLWPPSSQPNSPAQMERLAASVNIARMLSPHWRRFDPFWSNPLSQGETSSKAG
jgi:hypothetical protein